MENHCKEYHLKCLRQICRICSGRSLTVKDKKNKRSEIMCSSNAADINILFGINVFHDIPGVHSDVMCFKCYSRIKNYMKMKSDSMLASARETVEKSKKVWDVYNPDVHCKDCNICSTFDTTSKGAKKQKKSIGDVSSDSVSVFSDGNVSTVETSFDTVTSIDDSIPAPADLPTVSSTPLRERAPLNVSNISSTSAS